MGNIVFIDSEIQPDTGKILDLGVVKPDGASLHTASVREFTEFAAGADFVCGHNILKHDLKYVGKCFDGERPPVFIDTLPLSPLLFPTHPYHRLVKDDKLQSDELNNPLNDARKAMELFYDELNAFHALPSKVRQIYCALLYSVPEFQGFFRYAGYKPYPLTEAVVKEAFDRKLCRNARIDAVMKAYPVELAYALALIGAADYHSITPPWVVRSYPKVENVLHFLRGTPCKEGCPYCADRLDIHKGLKRIFGYDGFRTFNGEPLQENAANAAVHGKSHLAVFPTGGGKSVTFQLPALIAGEAVHGLTVVISPLQSLMKDQVDNLERLGIVDAVTVNGLLSPIERAEALERVQNGLATLLYISPEQLRSRTIERLLLSRNVVRFVIDEAHCFSAWGQDFRVDYLYIGDFIRGLQKKKGLKKAIPVSCFTATAKQKVISDIRDYFRQKLDLELALYATSAARENLRYAVLFKETDEAKYTTLRSLIEEKHCPTIVYVSRTRRTRELAKKLTDDGFPARPFNGKMDPGEKVENQNAFIRNEVRVIVATSAFGMGVDKKDVQLVVHYDISDSLENYVQEAGRAGRDQSLEAECYVLFNNGDLDKHFILLNQTKLSIGEIQQVWKAIKDLTRGRQRVCCSPLEIARQAGWDDSAGPEMETRVKTAISALETAGYVKRGRNMPRVYATGILARNMQEAAEVLDASPLFSDTQRQNAKRIIKSLISERSIAKAGNDDAESRVDYLADMLGIEKDGVIASLNLMRQAGLLEDTNDMSAYIRQSDTQNKSGHVLERFLRLEGFLLSILPDEGMRVPLKELNGRAAEEGVRSTVKDIRTLLYYWTIKGCIQKGERGADRRADIVPAVPVPELRDKLERRADICRFIVKELFARAAVKEHEEKETVPVEFSLIGLWKGYQSQAQTSFSDVRPGDIEDGLLYLSKTGALILEGGFLVSYNGMDLQRLITDNKIKYKAEDYKTLNEYYKQKIRQIHIVGEYANLMVRNYEAALRFVQDYFQMEFQAFIRKYFKGERLREISRNITPEKYDKLFGRLSPIQTDIINDDDSRTIVVAAGPGSGKTRVLVHKLASLYCMEDVKHEQMLMVTFSRAAATEFKKRLLELIENAAHFIEIKTFHSYCFDLLGKIGSLEGSADVVKEAAARIRDGEVEQGRITKTVVVIDEAQDMDENEFALIKALMRQNEDMRVIAVGDDDQNIYQFRGSDSRHFCSLISSCGAVLYEMNENYRSAKSIVALSNAFAETISQRMKTAPGIAAREEPGIVQLVKHSGRYLEQPVVEQFLQTYQGGNAAILTQTNQEALNVLGLLDHHGVRAELIQSMDGFSLYNLEEVRCFLQAIDRGLREAKISADLWESAKQELCGNYGTSACLPTVLNMLADFEATNRDRYRTDLEEFICESRIEDFYGDERKTVLVSTIHKSKGREFDSVYMLLNNASSPNEEERRKIYVGMTRARNKLYIHYNGTLFDRFALIPGVTQSYDTRRFSQPEEIVLQLGHRDVVLDFFKGKRRLISRLRSGQRLFIRGLYLTAEIESRTVTILKFSRAFASELQKRFDQGYEVTEASVRFVVEWKRMEDEEETAIVLPDIRMKRGQQENDPPVSSGADQQEDLQPARLPSRGFSGIIPHIQGLRSAGGSFPASP